MELSERIKKARKAAGYKSQAKLAGFLGTTRPAIMSYEMGRVTPNDVFLQLMAAKLNISYEWLKNGVGEMYPPDGSFGFTMPQDLDDVDREIIKIYAELPPELRKVLRDFAVRIATVATKDPPQAAPAPAPEEVEPCPPGITEEEWRLVRLHRKREAQEEAKEKAS